MTGFQQSTVGRVLLPDTWSARAVRALVLAALMLMVWLPTHSQPALAFTNVSLSANPSTINTNPSTLTLTLTLENDWTTAQALLMGEPFVTDTDWSFVGAMLNSGMSINAGTVSQSSAGTASIAFSTSATIGAGTTLTLVIDDVTTGSVAGLSGSFLLETNSSGTLETLTSGSTTLTLTAPMTTVQLVKDLVPTSDDGTFDLTVDGNTTDDQVDGGMTPAVAVTPGPAIAISEAFSIGSASGLGDYTIAISCQDQNTNPVTATPGVPGAWTILVAMDQEIVCTITNTRLPRVTVNKIFDPVDDDGTFDLSVDATSDGVTTTGPDLLGPQDVNVDVDATPLVAETATSGTVLADYTTTLTCVANGAVAVGSLPTAVTTTSMALPALPAGADIVCTFTNTRNGAITIVKDTVPNDAQNFDFDDDITGSGGTTGDDFTLDDDADGTLSNTESFANVTPGGPYTVRETAVAGWTLSDINCGSAGGSSYVFQPSGMVTFQTGDIRVEITLAAGDAVTCTFTNSKDGAITIVKDTVPDDAQDFVFDDDITGDGGMGGDDFTLDDDADGTFSNTESFANVTPGGPYAVRETAVGGWTLSDINCGSAGGSSYVFQPSGMATFQAMDISVDITLAAGDAVTCTFTNSKDGTIIIEKQTLPDGDGQAFVFAGAVNSGGLTDGQTAMQAVAPGQHTSTETVPSGWVLTSIVCSDSNSTGNTGTATATFNVEPGETVTCVFTNAKDGTITVTKEIVDPTDGGLNDEFRVTINSGDAFTVTNNAGGPDMGTSATVMVSGGSMVTIAESITAGPGALGDYARTLSCDNNVGTPTEGVAGTFNAFTAPAGADVTCTLTNTFSPPSPPSVIVTQTLTVTKIVVNDGGGTLTVADFPLWIDGNATTSGDAVSVTVGAHTVSETGADNYDAVISGDCDTTGAVTVASAGTASCTITNTFVPSDDLPPVPLPDLIFTDGFESGDTSVWTDVDSTPGPNSDSYQNGGGTNNSGLRTAQGAAVPIADAVASIVGDYDAIFVYDPTINAVNLSDNFLVYRPEPALAFLNTLTELRSGQAYFIFSSGADGIVWQQGLAIVEPRSVALVSGFNYVGWSGPELAPLADAIAGISADVFSAFLWDAEAQEYLVYWRDAPSALNLNTFDVIPFASGLWVLMDRAVTWLQPARDG